MDGWMDGRMDGWMDGRIVHSEGKGEGCANGMAPRNLLQYQLLRPSQAVNTVLAAVRLNCGDQLQ